MLWCGCAPNPNPPPPPVVPFVYRAEFGGNKVLRREMASRAAPSLFGDWQMLVNGAAGRSGGLAILAAAAAGSTAAAVMWRRRGVEGKRHPASKPVDGSARGGDADRASYSTPVKKGRASGLDDVDEEEGGEEEGRRAIFTPTKLFKGQEECSEVALVDSQLQQLLKEGALQLGSGLDLSSYVQPASLDVPITVRWLRLGLGVLDDWIILHDFPTLRIHQSRSPLHRLCLCLCSCPCPCPCVRVRGPVSVGPCPWVRGSVSVSTHASLQCSCRSKWASSACAARLVYYWD